MTATTDQLSARDVARLAGVQVNTIAAHRKRGTIPQPDGQLGDTLWWYRSTIEAWLATRRRQGQHGQPHGKERQ